MTTTTSTDPDLQSPSKPMTQPTRKPFYPILGQPDATDRTAARLFDQWNALAEREGWDAAYADVVDHLLAVHLWLDQVYGSGQTYRMLHAADALVRVRAQPPAGTDRATDPEMRPSPQPAGAKNPNQIHLDQGLHQNDRTAVVPGRPDNKSGVHRREPAPGR
jgi:hypothetical protein